MPRYALKGGFTAGLWPPDRTVFRAAFTPPRREAADFTADACERVPLGRFLTAVAEGAVGFFRAAAAFAVGFFFAAAAFAVDFFFAAVVFVEGFRAVAEDFTVFVDGFFFRPLLRTAAFDVLLLPDPAAEEVGFELLFFEGDFLAEAFLLVGDFFLVEVFFALLF
jgi:hypothetical protein